MSSLTEVEIEKIAKVCHETNRAFCQTIGDNSQPSWEEAPDWQKISAINGVKFRIANPNAGPDASHNNWLQEKVSNGWVYGEVKDPEKKTHPCILPYGELEANQRKKDHLFLGVVAVLTATNW